MAAKKRSSAKRSSAKRSSAKRSSAKRSSAKKGAARKSGTKRRGKGVGSRTKALKRTARKGLRVAQDGIETVRQVGEKTWETLRSTTANVVEGVKDKLGDDSARSKSYP
jgi:hypothetical protein